MVTIDETLPTHKELFETLASIHQAEHMERFMKDLCTPQELKNLAERWLVCKFLYEGKLSYREIKKKTGASLATITRVARFLKDEPHRGYKVVLEQQRERNQ